MKFTETKWFKTIKRISDILAYILAAIGGYAVLESCSTIGSDGCENGRTSVQHIYVQPASPVITPENGSPADFVEYYSNHDDE